MRRTIAAALLATAAATGAHADTNWWVPPGDVNRARLATLDQLKTAYAEFAWKTFIAINWPAVEMNGNPYPAPDTGKDLSYNAGDYVSVWEAWPTAQELFMPDGAAPAAWGSPHDPPSQCEEEGAQIGDVVLQATSKGGDVASEFVQAFRMGPVPDQNGKYTWFAIQANKAMYDYIMENELYNLEGQIAFGKAADWPRGRLDSSGSEQDIGSIFVKGAWKLLGKGDTPEDFHRIESWLYNPGDEDPGIPPSCRLESVGLTAFHVVHRTNSAPQWVWATFEHVANAPQYEEAMSGKLPRDHYSYFDTSCVKGTCEYNRLPDYPWNPDRAGIVPVQVVRLANVGSAAAEQNTRFQGEDPVQGTVFANYQLIDSQFATVLGSPYNGVYSVNPAYPAGEPAARFLANTLIETYIQGLPQTARTSDGYLVTPGDQAGAGGGVERMTSNCVGCHGDAVQTTGFFSNYVFMLNRAGSKSK